ncbi:hypothetical protein G7046_g2061 [Stylonectria norvegica]|nr:hypothetical protein G7046_g2061 [Stylonectria norvegica]
MENSPLAVRGLARFSSLCPELRLNIWQQALREDTRIIRLDALINVGVACYTAKIETERVVLGGTFWSQRRPLQDDIVCANESQRVIEVLSLVCYESRRVVLAEYPDLVRVEEPTAHFTTDEGPCLPGTKNRPPKRLMLRCNLNSDIFYFVNIHSGWWKFRNDVEFAQAIHNIVAMHETHKGSKSDDFRDVLRGIKNLVTEATHSPAWKHSRRVYGGLITGPKEDQYKNLLAGLSNLESLYVFQQPLLEEKKYQKKSVGWRESWEEFLEPVYYTTSMADINKAYDSAAEDEEDDAAFKQLLQQKLRELGFSNKYRPLKQLDLLSAAPEDDSEPSKDWLLLPKFGYLSRA